MVNNYAMPNPTCPLCKNTKHLMAVLERRFWVPKLSEIRQRAMLKPPMKKLLLEAVEAEMKMSEVHKDLKLGFDSATQVDKRWLIDLLSTLNYDHAYFARDYVPQPNERQEEPEQELMINNPDDFFTGLQPPKRKGKGKKARNIFITAEQREQIKLQKLERRGR